LVPHTIAAGIALVGLSCCAFGGAAPCQRTGVVVLVFIAGFVIDLAWD
jgi:hypothetical protein